MVLKILKFVLFASLGAFLLYLSFKGIDLNTFWQELVKADFRWIFISLSAAFVAFISRAYRWKLLVETIDENVSLKHTFHSMMLGYLANFVFPRIGEVTRCGALAKLSKAPVEGLLGTVIIERLLDLLVMIVLMIVVIIARIDLFGGFIGDTVIQPIYEKSCSIINSSPYIVIAIILFLVALLVMVLVFKETIKKITLVKKISKLGKGLLNGMKGIYQLKKRKEFILHTLLIWFMYWLMTYVLFFVIPATSHLGPLDGLFILVIGSFAFVAPVQAGMGAFQALVSMALMIYGLSKEEGLLFSVISHESQSIFTIIVGAVSFFALFLAAKKKDKIAKSDGVKI